MNFSSLFLNSIAVEKMASVIQFTGQRNKRGKILSMVISSLKYMNELLGKILFLLKDRGITYSRETCVGIIGGHGINLQKISELQ